MYGLVNRAVLDLPRVAHGEDAVARTLAAAGVEDEVFVSNEGYDDAITYRLVVAASEETGTPVDELLRAFGRWWVTSTARDGYGSLLQAGGSTMEEFLDSLPDLHARIELI